MATAASIHKNKTGETHAKLGPMLQQAIIKQKWQRNTRPLRMTIMYQHNTSSVLVSESMKKPRPT